MNHARHGGCFWLPGWPRFWRRAERAAEKDPRSPEIQNLLGVARYMYDAVDMALPLVGGDVHDFNYLHPDRHPFYQGREVHSLQSVTKSVAATLTGIAIDRGHLPGTSTTLGEAAPGLIPRGADPAVAGITVADLLTMQAGLERTSGPNYGAWVASRNWVADGRGRAGGADGGDGIGASGDRDPCRRCFGTGGRRDRGVSGAPRQ